MKVLDFQAAAQSLLWHESVYTSNLKKAYSIGFLGHCQVWLQRVK